MKPRILVLQSSAPSAPAWVRRCMRSVEDWCVEHDHDYVWTGDNMFGFLPISTLRYARVTQSDLARLEWIRARLLPGDYDAVYWLDSDFLIWNRYEFQLPMPRSGSVVCAGEAALEATGLTVLAVNNSVLGLCDVNDAEILLEKSKAILAASRGRPRPTVIGTDLFSSSAMPLRRIIAKQAGCFSAATIRRILGPYEAGRRHLFWLGVASGATLYGANLCSSRKTNDAQMLSLVVDLLHGETPEIGNRRYLTSFYRTWLRVAGLPDRVRCWMLSRWYEIRQSLTQTS